MKEQLISLALDVIEKVLKNNEIIFINIKFKFNSFQEYSFESENLEATEESLTKFNEKIQEISYELMLHIQNLSEIDLIDDWQSRYWDVLLREQNDINYSINPLFLGKRSRFYNDIINREDQAKGKLLLWQEEFLTQEYEKAKKYCEEIRIENGIGDAQIYEYLLLTYSKDIGANNLIKSFLSSAKSTSFDKLLLYLERAQHLGGQTSTLSDSLMEVYMDLMSSINRYYQNISYDYVSAPAQKGRSQKRNIIKGCIEATVMIYTSFHETLDKSKLHPIVEDMIVEIEGGGKYDWVKMQNDELTDKTTFDAIKKRETLLEMIHSSGNDIKLSDYLYGKLIMKKEKINNQVPGDDSNEKLFNACKVAYCIYREERFIELVKDKNFNKSVKMEPEKKKENLVEKRSDESAEKVTMSVAEAEFYDKLKKYESREPGIQINEKGIINENLISQTQKEEQVYKENFSYPEPFFFEGLKKDIKNEPRIKIQVFLGAILLAVLICANGFYFFGVDFLVVGILIIIVESIIFFQITKHVNFKNNKPNN